MEGIISDGNLLIRFKCPKIVHEIAWVTMIHRKSNIFEIYGGTLVKRKTVGKRYLCI